MEVVYVRWVDAAAESVLGNPDSLVPAPVVSTGILLEDNEHYIRFYQSRFFDNEKDTQYREVMVIPKQWAMDVQRFTVK